MKTKLPKTLFITRENEGLSDEYFDTRKEKSDLVAMGEIKIIGEYVLKRQVKVRGVVEELREKT